MGKFEVGGVQVVHHISDTQISVYIRRGVTRCCMVSMDDPLPKANLCIRGILYRAFVMAWPVSSLKVSFWYITMSKSLMAFEVVTGNCRTVTVDSGYVL